MLITWC